MASGGWVVAGGAAAYLALASNPDLGDGKGDNGKQC